MPITINKTGTILDADLKSVELRRNTEGAWTYAITYPKGDGSNGELRETPESETQAKINIMWDHLKSEAKTKIAAKEGI